MRRNCDYCGQAYIAKRSTSRFCSTSCRVAYNRLSDNINALHAQMTRCISDMEHITDNYPEFVCDVDSIITSAKNRLHALGNKIYPKVLKQENEGN